MKLVVIESPFWGQDTIWEGDVAGNVDYARRCILDCLSRNEAPIASHLLFPQVLNDGNPGQRAAGLTAGRSWIRAADLVAVYIDRGISKGMKEAMNTARIWDKVVEMRKLEPAADKAGG